MKSIKNILIILRDEFLKQEIGILKNFILTIKPDKIKFSILVEEHDYFTIDNLNLDNETEKYIKNQIQIPVESIQYTNEKEIIESTIKDNIDLIIAFNYIENELIDDYISKILTNSFANVLLLPRNLDEFNIHKIIVATDFSDYSKKALEYGLEIQSMFKNSTLKVLHVAPIPIGYHYTGLSLEEFGNRLKENSNEKMKEFLNNNIPYEITTVYKHNKVVSEILRIASTEKTDLLIVGSQGTNSKLELLYPGSTTIKLIGFHTMPLLIVKVKEKHRSFIEKIFLK